MPRAGTGGNYGPDGEPRINPNPGRKCDAKTTSGQGRRCIQPAGAGTDHLGWGRCKSHGGSTRSGKLVAAKEEAAARLPVLGVARDIEPVDALLEQVRMSAGHVNWYLDQIRRYDVQMGPDTDAKYLLMQLSETGWDRAAWVRLYNDERDRLTRYAKMALDAGVAERQVKMAEQQGELIAQVLRGVLKDLGLSAEQEIVAPQVVERHLRLLAS